MSRPHSSEQSQTDQSDIFPSSTLSQDEKNEYIRMYYLSWWGIFGLILVTTVGTVLFSDMF